MAEIRVEAGRPATETLMKVADSVSIDSFSLLDLVLPWMTPSRTVEVYPIVEPATGRPYLGLRYFESGIDVGGIMFRAEILAESLSDSAFGELVEYDSFLGLSTLSKKKPVLSTHEGLEVLDAAVLSGDLYTRLELKVEIEKTGKEASIQARFDWLTSKNSLNLRILLE